MDPQSLIVSHLLPWRKLFLSHYGKSEANPMGSTWQSFHFICDWETKIELSKKRPRMDLFWNLENLYCPDGWVGGDQNGPSIFLKFRYINK